MINILQIILFLSLLGIFLIVVRKIPILMKFPRQPEVVFIPQPFFKKIFHFRISKYFILLINLAEKTLRKLRIVFLKMDNFFIQWIQKVREKSQVWTIRYQAWLPQRKMWRIKVKHQEKEESIADDFKAEEQAYIKLLAQDPKNAEIYRKLANLYLAQKNYQDAVQALQQVLKLKPQDKRAMAKLEKIQAIIGDSSVSSMPS